MVVNLDPGLLRASPPPLLRFDDSPPRHLDALCTHECVTSLTGSLTRRASRSSARPECSDLECFRMHSLSSHFGCLTVRLWRRYRWRYHWNLSLYCCRWHLFVAIRIPVSTPTFKFHFVPRASTVSRRLHCSPGGFPRTDLHLSTPNFVPTRCSYDDASRRHQQPLIHLFVSLAARTSCRGSTRIPFHQTCTEVKHTVFQASTGMAFCRRVALRILRAQIQRNGLQMKLLKAVCQCSSRFVSGTSCESLHVSVYCFDKPAALMTCFWRKSLHCSGVSFACNFSTHVNDTHLFVALNDRWIEETTSFKMSQDFLRQILVTTFPSAHEADHYSTERFPNVIHG